MSFLLRLDPRQRIVGRFIDKVRQEILMAFEEEASARGLTQEQAAEALAVNKSVISRKLQGQSNLTLRSIGEFAWVLDREIVFELKRRPKVEGTGHRNIKEQPITTATSPTSPHFVVTKKPAHSTLAMAGGNDGELIV